MAKLGIEAHLYVHVYVTLTTPTNNDIQLTFDVYTQLTGISNMQKSSQNNQNNRHHHPAPSSTPSSPFWLVNQRCLALWKDGYMYPAKIVYTTKKQAYVEFEADEEFHKVGYDCLESLSSSECDSSSQEDSSKQKTSRKDKHNSRNPRKRVRRVGIPKTRTDKTDAHGDGSGSGDVDSKSSSECDSSSQDDTSKKKKEQKEQIQQPQPTQNSQKSEKPKNPYRQLRRTPGR